MDRDCLFGGSSGGEALRSGGGARLQSCPSSLIISDHPARPPPTLRSSLKERRANEYAPWAIALPYLYGMYPKLPCGGKYGQYLGTKLLAGFIEQVRRYGVMGWECNVGLRL